MTSTNHPRFVNWLGCNSEYPGSPTILVMNDYFVKGLSPFMNHCFF